MVCIGLLLDLLVNWTSEGVICLPPALAHAKMLLAGLLPRGPHPIASFSSQGCHIKVTELLHAISMTALWTSSIQCMCMACCDKPALLWYQMIMAALQNLHCKHAVNQSML